MVQYSQALSLRSLMEPPGDLMTEVDILRIAASRKLAPAAKETMGQFLTPAPTADLMAAMFEQLDEPNISLLDAGAGIGSLLAAFVSILCQREKRPKHLRVVAYEIDPILIQYLNKTLKLCSARCQTAGIEFVYEIREVDFIEDAARLLEGGLLSDASKEQFTHTILNPPYSKISAHSKTRAFLRLIGLETTNLYTGFMAAAAMLLRCGGEMVSITPRSFCNGMYFRDFRRMFLDMMTIRQVHLFDSRQEAFKDDQVLQETIIIHSHKQKLRDGTVVINTSAGAQDDLLLSHRLPYTDVVNLNDPEKFIRILPDRLSQQIVEQMQRFTCSLNDLGLTVSTGKVVDFRAKEYLRSAPEANTVPLLYPVNLVSGSVKHPQITKKPQALVHTQATANLLIPNEHYVLCKRFSSKEEKRRLVAVVYDADQMNCEYVGFENHLNYFHINGHGLDLTLAYGLAAYLNSSLVDSFFRLFNGHTQVNATDLRSLAYPTQDQLIALGARINGQTPSQQNIDTLVEEELLSMTDQSTNNPMAIKSRIEESLGILTQLGFPRAQLNERSALTLLALLDIKPNESWELAKSPLIGITPMMNFMAEHYGKAYKPNTRETVRRETVHQFLDAALIVANPDDPERPINSPKTVYQLEESALELMRTFGSAEWEKSIQTYLASIETLKERYAQEREMARIPIVIDGNLKTLSPGGQNVLIKEIIDEFAPRFTPGGIPIYIGDTDEKFAHFNQEALAALGVSINSHGKMPDVIIHFTKNNWLVLIEAVTSHGPINAKRKSELENLFKYANVPIVMVTTFLSRKAMVKYLSEIAWETDVWVADDASHLIHFNGQHLLQLYQE